jgi:hypothetical protein
VRIEAQYQELSDGTLILGPPKSDAGVRAAQIRDYTGDRQAATAEHFIQCPDDTNSRLFR